MSPASGKGCSESIPTEPHAAPRASAKDLDHAVRAGIARITGGLAPSALAGAFLDWAVHLAASPAPFSRT